MKNLFIRQTIKKNSMTNQCLDKLEDLISNEFIGFTKAQAILALINFYLKEKK